MRPSAILPLLAFVTVACAPALRPLAPTAPVRMPEMALPDPPAESPPPAAPIALSDEEYLRVRALMVPVEGVRPEKVADTYWQDRDGGARVHQAVDILAKRGTPVLSADSGTVLRISKNSLGGNVIYATDPARRFVFYYAHLDGYAEGLYEGKAVSQGEVLGYVGTTGNAPKNTPHLHFQVMRYVDARQWWNGPPFDPRPYLAQLGVRAGTSRATAAVPDDQ